MASAQWLFSIVSGLVSWGQKRGAEFFAVSPCGPWCHMGKPQKIPHHASDPLTLGLSWFAVFYYCGTFLTLHFDPFTSVDAPKPQTQGSAEETCF